MSSDLQLEQGQDWAAAAAEYEADAAREASGEAADEEVRETAQAEAVEQHERNFGEQLKNQTTGCRVATFSLSVRRTMPKGAISEVAEHFAAQESSLSGSRQVINRKHPLVRPVYRALKMAKEMVHAYTIDYPEKGVRLVKLDRVEWLREQINEIRGQLDDALVDLDSGWQAVKDDAKERLGDLYNDGDYPPTPSLGFGIELSFPAIQPDDRLARLHPELYAQEQARIRVRFEEAVQIAEAKAAEELSKMLAHLVSRMQPDPETGKAKTINASAVDNLKEFAERFRTISVGSMGSNADLERLISEVESAASGVDIKALRAADGSERATLAESFERLREQVDSLVISRPVRDIDLD